MGGLFLEETSLHVVAGSPVFERLNFADKLADVVELPVDRDVSHIGYWIDLVELVHDLGPDNVGRDLGNVILVEFGKNLLDRPVETVHRHRPLLAGLDETSEELFSIDRLAAAVLLHYSQLRTLDLLVGGIAVRAVQTFAASPNRRPVFRHPGIYDFVFVGTALDTPHWLLSGTGCYSTCGRGKEKSTLYFVAAGNYYRRMGKS